MSAALAANAATAVRQAELAATGASRATETPAVREPDTMASRPAAASARPGEPDADVEPAEPGAPATGAGEALPSNSNPDETNVWPDEAAEQAFIAETRGRGESPVATAAPAEAEEERAPKALPPLSEVVERVPAETRELLDELFRAKFIAVRKLKKSDLKPVG